MSNLRMIGYTVAEQCRTLGLEVGDTIEGTEGGKDWWNTTRLTLLWLGENEACWLERHITDKKSKWSEPTESCSWSLSCRDWKKI